MKLFLSSYKLGNNPENFAKMFGTIKKVAVIANALDEISDQELRNSKVAENITALADIGLQGEELDLRNFFKNTAALKEKLSGYGGVLVRGGNSFVLRRAMAYSGFDKLITQKSEQADFVYGGYSAGVCVLGPDLHGIDLVDPVDVIPAGYQSQIIWSGLGIIKYHFAPHFHSDHPESADIEKSIEYFKKHKLSYKALHDGEVILGDTLLG